MTMPTTTTTVPDVQPPPPFATAPIQVTAPPPPAPAPAGLSPVDIQRIQDEAVERARVEMAAQLAEQQRRSDAMAAEVAALTGERDQQRQAAEAAATEQARLAEEARQAELSATARLAEGQASLADQVGALTTQLRDRDALLEKERNWADLQAYRSARLTAEQDAIMPTLVDFVAGNTRAEVDASIELVKQRTADTVAQMQQATRQQFIAAPGTAPSGAPPAGGPMETVDGRLNLSAEDLRDMPMAQYAQLRSQLLGKARDAYHQGGAL